MPRLRTTISLSVLLLLVAVAGSVWMSAWPRMQDKSTEAAVAARAGRGHVAPSVPKPSRRHRATAVKAAAPVASPPSAPSLQPLYAPSPRYPIEALRAHRGGTVILRVQLGADGHVVAAAVAHSSGDTAFDASALDAVRQWRFPPSSAASRAPLLLPVHFRIGTASASTHG